jgi:hypothetical protein
VRESGDGRGVGPAPRLIEKLEGAQRRHLQRVDSW